MLVRTALLLSVLAVTALAEQPPVGRPAIYPLEKVAPGLEGTGWTVMAGEVPVSFRARVEGVVAQDVARGPMIVCSLSGAGIEETGVLAAMSGSPVYAEGKLLGAVAYTWSFSKKSLCGLTPAVAFLPLLDGTGEGSGGSPGGAPAATVGDLLARRPLSLSGGTDRLAAFGALQAAGFAWAGPSPPTSEVVPEHWPQPGEAIAAELICGDLQFAAFGTVAVVDRERFVAFGHPFMRLGPVDLPVAAARVDALVPSLERGMKLCSTLSEVGALRMDSGTGVAGVWGARAPTLPVTLKLSGAQGPPRVLKFKVARHRFLTPLLLQGALGQAQMVLEGTADPKTVTLRFGAQLAGGDRLELNPLQFSGPSPFVPLNEFAGNVLDLLLNNSYEPVVVESLDIELASRPGLSGGTLRSLEPDRATAVAGEPFSLRAGLQPLRGAARSLVVPLQTGSWPEGEVVFWVGDAFSLFRKLEGTEATTPASAREILGFLRRVPSNDRLYVAVLVPSVGRTVTNRRLDAPPPSMSGLLGPVSTPPSEAPPAFRLLAVKVGPETGAFEGLVELTVPVRPARR